MLGPQASPLSPGPGGRLAYLQGGEEDATRDGHTDLIVVVDLLFAIGGKTVYLFENENQNGSCVQVLFNPISSEGEKKEIFQRIFALMIFCSFHYFAYLCCKKQSFAMRRPKLRFDPDLIYMLKAIQGWDRA